MARYLNDDLVRAWRMPSAWAVEWWLPGDLAARVDEQCEGFDGDAFFNAPNLKPLREARAAAAFALYIQKSSAEVRVRMVTDTFPDFYLKVGEGLFEFELVEADREARRRGEEYRELARRAAAHEQIKPEFYNPWAEKRDVPEAIRRVIGGKARKQYAAAPHLLVVVNFGNMGGPALVEHEASTVTQEWHNTFKSIWLLCGDEAVRCSGSIDIGR